MSRPIISLLIDNGSALNGVFQELVSQLGLTTKPIEKPYQLTWIDGFQNDGFAKAPS